MISILVAVDEKGGIGKGNNLMWNIPSDLKRFKEITTKDQIGINNNINNIIIMGKKTYDSIGRQLPDRVNVILSLKDKHSYSIKFEDVLDYNERFPEEELFVIGGEEIYKQFLPYTDKIYLTRVRGDFGADKFFYFDEDMYELTYRSGIQKDNGYEFEFLEYCVR